MIVDILVSYLTQVLFTIGVIYLFGWLIALCNKKFYQNLGAFGTKACYISGFIGTPVHECSHALMCLIFGHKIKAIKLFQISSTDGTLGYVSHSFNRKNVYHQIGNFFIGVAPIICISAILYLMAYLMVPQMVQDVMVEVQSINVNDGFSSIIKTILNAVIAFFSHAGNGWWWLFVLIGTFLALHMTLSDADIKGSWTGLVIILALILVMDIIIGLLNQAFLLIITQGFVLVGGFITGFLTLGTLISLILVVISFLFKNIKNQILKRRYRL